MVNPISNSPDFNECVSCGSIDLKQISNQVICLKCGFVLSLENVDHLRGLETEKIKIDDKLTDHILPENVFHKEMISNWWGEVRISDATEKNLAQGFAELTRIWVEHDLPIAILKDASNMYQNLAKNHSFKGYSFTGITLAILYISSKKSHTFLTPDVFSKKLDLDKKELIRCIKFVRKSFNIKTLVVNPIQYLPSLCDKLKLSNNNRIIIEKILSVADELKLTSGKNPVGIIAAAAYISSILTDNSITQRELSETTRVTQTTIRNRYKEIMKHVNIEVKI
jgi:transcription initiation factor TFIIB